MKKLIAVLVLLVAAITWAVVCPEPQTIDIPDAPAKVLSHITIEADKGEYGFQVKACDPDGDPVTVTALQLPDGMTLDVNDTLLWEPTNEQIGDHWVVFQATDSPPDGNSLSDTAAYLITVQRVTNNPPVLLPFVAVE